MLRYSARTCLVSHRHREDAALEKQERGHRELITYLKHAPVLAVEPHRLSSRLKYRTLLDPHRSRAYPMAEEERDAGVVAKEKSA